MHTDPTPEGPQITRCRTTADFLAALPWLVGEVPRNCLLIVDFARSRAGVAARIPLPREHTPGVATALVESVLSLLERSGSIDREPAVVIVTDQRFGLRGEAPFRTLADQLLRRLRRSGWFPRELACMAADGWIGFLERSDARAMRPLSQIEASRAALGLDPAELPSDPGALPVCRPDLAAEVTARCAELGLGAPWPPAASETWADETIELLEAAEAPGFATTAEWCARFAQAVSTPQGWFVFAMVAVSDRVLIDSVVHTYGASALAATCVDRTSAAERGGGEAVSIWNLLSDIVSTPRMRTRLRAVLPILSDATSQLPAEWRAGPLSLIGWFWWLCGMPSVAERRIDEALELDPEHALVRLAQRFLTLDPVAEWAVRSRPSRIAA
ncbi:DUF4192 family protein [Leucobacter iarius]|uniref:DUF4192 family protein n=1 Tax=Leucobacter iarius TaxID=333963 RepID=A0ABN2LMT1_9MICO